jgi:hypothetical protein
MLVDDSRLPVLVFNVHEEGTVSDMLAFLHGVLTRREPFVCIADGSKGVRISLGALERKALADFFREQREALKESCLGIVTVSNSAIVRGVITAINWVSPLPVPGAVVGTRAEADRWAAERIADRQAEKARHSKRES